MILLNENAIYIIQMSKMMTDASSLNKSKTLNLGLY